MPPRVPYLVSAQAMFPPSAAKRVMVRWAWRKDDSTLDAPSTGGSEGWTSIVQPATYEVVRGLRDKGYTFVTLENGSAANPFVDVAITRLI